jgi:hypothetical protein
MLATLDYPQQAAHPEFNLSLRVNFKSGVPKEQFGFRFIGSGGTMTTSMTSLTLEKTPPERAPGLSLGTFTKAMQEQIQQQYREQYPPAPRPTPEPPFEFAPPKGYDAHREHHRVFYEAVRARKQPVEDVVFGMRAAGPALLANTSYFERRICRWDAEKMRTLA